jgi:hypothetical protein
MTQFTCKGVKQINNRISLNMTFTFTIRNSRRFSSVREFQMRNFQKYWLQNVGQDFTGGRFRKWTGGAEGTLKIGRKMLPPEGSHVCFIETWNWKIVIKKGAWEGWNPINWFNPATFLWLSQAMTWSVIARIAAIINSYKPTLCKHESDNLWCRGKLLISIKQAMNSSRIELLWLDWNQSRSKYYLRTNA